MTGNWKRPEYIELSAEEIEWHMRRGRQLRSRAAFDMMHALSAFIRRTVSAVFAARHLPDSARIQERRIHI